MDTHALQKLVVDQISKHGESLCNSSDIANHLNEDHQKIVGILKSLESVKDYIYIEPISTPQIKLTDEGKAVAENGSYEKNLYDNIPDDGILQIDLLKLSPNSNIGFSKAMSLGWIRIDKSDKSKPKVFKKVNQIEDTVQKQLDSINSRQNHIIPPSTLSEYKKRKLIVETLVKSFNIVKGPQFGTSIKKEVPDVTPEMIINDTWKETKFKKYNFNAMGIQPSSGHFHPLMKVKSQFRQIFLEMGFSEMDTSKYVESSFWNFDALFQPQNHPARDEHDTFFMSDPKTSHKFPQDYLERVKQIHSKGGHGSLGYNYDWKIEEAQKNILRTHTTAISSRTLYELAKRGFQPCKYFSIDKVYRNESLDATHLAEFHQIEGVIADRNLSLGDLKGVLTEFFKKLGITRLRFKATYNPYTEPSMEVYSFHEGLKKWVEIGNSGIFRPEMLMPMGLPPDISVIAWGLSLERPTMILYGISNIRELVGHKVNLQMVYDSQICFFP